MPTTAFIQPTQLQGLKAWRLHQGRAQVLVTSQGAQVLEFGVEGEAPIIWSNPHAQYVPGEAIRSGIPVCWPWFGALSANPELIQAGYNANEKAPFHGLVRQVEWDVGDIFADEQRAQISFHHRMSPSLTPEWPHDAQLELRVGLQDNSLNVSLVIHNSGNSAIAMTQALHTYFATSDVQKVQLKGFSGSIYYDCLDDWALHQQLGEPNFTQETDRIYQGLSDQLSINDATWGRRIILRTTGSSSAILWNPWVEKSSRLDQFSPGSWPHMLCIETARAMDNLLVIEAGAIAEMSVTISRELTTLVSS